MRAISFAVITGFWLLVAACASLSPPTEQPKALQWEAATECEARFSDIRVKEIDYYGRLSFEYGAPGGINYRDDFIACYQRRVQKKITSLISSGRLSPSARPTARSSVPIKVVADKILVSATINESQQAFLILDTGATYTILRPALLERLGISVPAGAPRWKFKFPLLFGQEPISMPFARVRLLKVGGVAVEEIDVGVYDVFPNAPGVDGLLGGNFLNHFRVTIDPSSQRLTLEVITEIFQKGATDLLRLEPGWTLHEKLGEGFAIALPATWKPIDIDLKTLEAGFIRAKHVSKSISTTHRYPSATS
jgi:predicted aspartyl protease